MAKNMLMILLAICLSLKCVSCEVGESTSVVEKIHFEYKNEKWTCGNTECPEGTIGCKIVAHAFESDILYYGENCLDENNLPSLGNGTHQILEPQRKILIILDTYIGAKSNFSVAYELGDHESAEGTVAVNELDMLKEEFKKVKTEKLSHK